VATQLIVDLSIHVICKHFLSARFAHGEFDPRNDEPVQTTIVPHLGVVVDLGNDNASLATVPALPGKWTLRILRLFRHVSSQGW